MKPFRYCRDPLFLVSCAAYALNRWGLKPYFASAFLHDHFNDLLLIPCALPPLLWLHRALGWRRAEAPPSVVEVVSHLAVWIVVCEVAGPKWITGTADVWDSVSYSAGAVAALVFWWRHALFGRSAGPASAVNPES